jgi:probable lipoprotein NlpC
MAYVRFFQPRIVLLFLTAVVLCAGFLSAAPLEKGFALAPPLLASPEEKTAAYREARLRVLAAADDYQHTPYRYGGLDRRGLDCSGLVYVSFQDALGVTVPRNAWSLYSWVERITIKDALPGDLVFFATTGNGTVSHVGIFVGNGRFIHSASDGPSTGVIYSSLDEKYWSRTYTGVGRALPEADVVSGAGAPKVTKENHSEKQQRQPQKQGESNLLMGVAFAPTWNAYIPGGGVIRGVAGQFRLGAEVKPFGKPMIFGVEVRPELDGALGIFRIPLTLSWGFSDKLRFFAGPVLSIGDAALTFSGEKRTYTGGTSWFGAVGVSAAPFALKIANGNLSPYGELAWQSYFSNNTNNNFAADLVAGLRFSTGLRYTWRK